MVLADKAFVSDCEGPISKNDNAFELSSHFIPKGGKFFTILSRYDDVIADVLKRENYEAGTTLKLILPFLKAYGATNTTVRKFSAGNLLLIPGAKNTLQHIQSIMPSFIVSTSYEHYLRALSKHTGFPFSNIFCTAVDFNGCSLNVREKTKLKQIVKEITVLPEIRIPREAQSLGDFSSFDRKTIGRLDTIFNEEIPVMECSSLLSEVSLVGGLEKANALNQISNKTAVSLNEMMYVGDSITDVASFRLLSEKGGLPISFNGNEYAVKEAEIVVLSENTIVTSILADTFSKFGREGVFQLVEDWGQLTLRKIGCPSALSNRMQKLYPRKFPRVELVTSSNVDNLTKESERFRKKIRGEVVGRLG